MNSRGFEPTTRRLAEAGPPSATALGWRPHQGYNATPLARAFSVVAIADLAKPQLHSGQQRAAHERRTDATLGWPPAPCVLGD